MRIWCFDNFLPVNIMYTINNEFKNILWRFGSSSTKNDDHASKFWYKELINTNSILEIKKHIEISCDKEIKIDRMYMNGQAHSQSGFWHIDAYKEPNKEKITMVYFLKPWPPEYGGHLMIKTENDVFSFLPKQNRAVFFQSHMEHMALEPSCYCKTQRESIAVKFTIQE